MAPVDVVNLESEPTYTLLMANRVRVVVEHLRSTSIYLLVLSLSPSLHCFTLLHKEDILLLTPFLNTKRFGAIQEEIRVRLTQLLTLISLDFNEVLRGQKRSSQCNDRKEESLIIKKGSKVTKMWFLQFFYKTSVVLLHYVAHWPTLFPFLFVLSPFFLRLVELDVSCCRHNLHNRCAKCRILNSVIT